MLVLGKTAIATIVLASTGTAGTILWINITGIPSFRDLSTDIDFKETYKDKYASKYSKYFIGVHNQGKEKIDNIKWWEWSFKNRYQTIKQEEIDKSFKGKRNGNELREACKRSYALDSKPINERDIWIFCSIGGNKPTTVYEKDKDRYSPGTYGKDETISKLLISTTDNKNNWFWKIKEKERLENLEVNSSSRFKSKIGNGDLESMLFPNSRRVKEICQEAYKQTKDSEPNKFPKADIYKFCTL